MPDENKLANIEPETREETFLQDIADGTQTLTPAVRKEEFLRRISAKPGVPSIAESDEGKILVVDNGEAAWGESSSLPEITAQDEGKVLTVDNGEAVWGEGGGGGVLYAASPAIPEGEHEAPIDDELGYANIYVVEYGTTTQYKALVASGPMNGIPWIRNNYSEGEEYPVIYPPGEFYAYLYESEMTPVADDPTSETYILTLSAPIAGGYFVSYKDILNHSAKDVLILPYGTTLAWVRLAGGD